MSSPAKTCVLCGEDCSGRPRVRDRNGRYACRTCAEQAHDRAQDTAAITELLGPPPDESPARRRGVRNLFRGGRGS